MFCTKCGKEMPEGAEVCPECGAKRMGAAGSSTSNIFIKWMEKFRAMDKPHQQNAIVIAAIAVIAVVIIIAGFSKSGGQSYEKVLDQYIDASLNADGEKLVKLMPDTAVNATVTEGGYLNKDELITEINEMLQSSKDAIDEVYGEGWKYSYEIIEEEDYSTSDVRELREDFRDDYGISLEIEAVKELEVEITINPKGDDLGMTESMQLDMIRVGNTWYLWEL